jgi:hypothetical protein
MRLSSVALAEEVLDASTEALPVGCARVPLRADDGSERSPGAEDMEAAETATFVRKLAEFR